MNTRTAATAGRVLGSSGTIARPSLYVFAVGESQLRRILESQRFLPKPRPGSRRPALVPALFIGRAAIYGLAAGGEAGVRRAALLGCPSIEDLGPQYLRRARREPAVVRPLPLGSVRTA